MKNIRNAIFKILLILILVYLSWQLWAPDAMKFQRTRTETPKTITQIIFGA